MCAEHLKYGKLLPERCPDHPRLSQQEMLPRMPYFGSHCFHTIYRLSTNTLALEPVVQTRPFPQRMPAGGRRDYEPEL